MQIFKTPNFDFLRWRWYALALSWLVILGGVAVMMTRGLPLGVEFSGGTIVILQFDQQPPDIGTIRGAIEARLPGDGQNAVIQRYGVESQRQVMVRVPSVGQESGAGLSEAADRVVAALKGAGVGTFNVIGTEIVGPAVGADLKRKGILATVLSLGGILLYIAFRFQFSFAVGTVVATMHDLLVTLAFLAFFRYDLSLNVIAAILTVTGYSTNDTIVIFDRVRENLRGMRRDSLYDVVNLSVNQTLSRTVITAGTALLSAMALFFFGGDVLHGFAFTMMVGIITGTYSSVFIASAIAIFWQGRSKSPGALSRMPPAEAAAARARRPTRRRAS
ncbi:MAG: protein translocase subunit SecF [Acidobacteriota bacterium]|nr:protein translocase subunit SecF [Acidobacteriota bacterium]